MAYFIQIFTKENLSVFMKILFLYNHVFIVEIIFYLIYKQLSILKDYFFLSLQKSRFSFSSHCQINLEIANEG